MDRIRFGIIGCGYQARKNMAPAMAASTSVELMGFFDTDAKSSESLACEYGTKQYTSLDNLLSDPFVDAVYIATPTVSHLEICLKAATAGKHILCEKSLAMNASDAKRIAAACAENGLCLKEGFMFRHHTQHQFVRDTIAKGEIGEPILFSAWFGYPPRPATDFRMSPELGGGAILDAGGYVVNAARMFWGREALTTHSVIKYNMTGLDLGGSAMLDFGFGQTAHLAFGMNNSYKNCYSVWGTEGEISLIRAFSIPALENPVCRIVNQGIVRECQLPACNHFAQELEDFAKTVLTRQFDYDEPVNQAETLERLRVSKDILI